MDGRHKGGHDDYCESAFPSADAAAPHRFGCLGQDRLQIDEIVHQSRIVHMRDGTPAARSFSA